MELILKPKVRALCALFICQAVLAQAQEPSLVMGQKLSQDELARHASSAQVIVLDGRELKVLPSPGQGSGAAMDPISFVIDANGVVGQSRNEVFLSNIDCERLEAAIQELKPISSRCYEHTAIGVIRFASLAQAIDARNRLRKILPQGRADVPIRYTKANPR